MSDTLEVKKENVKKAAETCDTAKEVLEELFPEAFEDDGLIKISPFKVDQFSSPIMIAYNLAPMGMKDRCFALSNDYKWEIVNNAGHEILIPRKK